MLLIETHRPLFKPVCVLSFFRWKSLVTFLKSSFAIFKGNSMKIVFLKNCLWFVHQALTILLMRVNRKIFDFSVCFWLFISFWCRKLKSYFNLKKPYQLLIVKLSPYFITGLCTKTFLESPKDGPVDLRNFVYLVLKKEKHDIEIEKIDLILDYRVFLSVKIPTEVSVLHATEPYRPIHFSQNFRFKNL